MDKEVKFILVGAVLSVLILAVGFATSLSDHSHLASLLEKCKEEVTHPTKSSGSSVDEFIAKLKAPWIDASIACDPEELSKSRTGNETGIQKEIIEFQSLSGSVFRKAKVAALIIFVLFCIPYAWYFLLRRIREVRDAVT